MGPTILRALAAALVLLSGAVGAAGAPEPRMEAAVVDPRDAPSLQRGARMRWFNLAMGVVLAATALWMLAA